MKKFIGMLLMACLFVMLLCSTSADGQMWLKQSTSVTVRIGPIVDVTDYFTPEVDVDVSASDECELLKHNGIAVVDMSGVAMTDVPDCNGWYDLMLTTSHTDTVGMLTYVLQDDNIFLPVSIDFLVVHANFYNLFSGTTVSIASIYSDALDASDITDDWETQSQADPTGFHVNLLEVNGTLQTANDNGADINTLVNQVGTAGDGLTAIDLPNQTMDVTGNITGNLSGSVGSLTGHTNQTADHTANITAVLLDTGTTIPGTITTVQNDLDTLTGAAGALLDTTATSPQLVDDVWDEVLTGATHNVATSAGRRLRQAQSVLVIHEGTSPGGGANDTIVLQNTASGTSNWYNEDWIILVGGTGEGQIRHVETYVGNTFTATMASDWHTNPDATSEYIVMARSSTHVHAFRQNALDQINAEVDTAFNTAVPGAPTANSINQRIVALDTDWEDGGRLDLLLDTVVAAPYVLDTTVNTVTSTTVFTLAAGITNDNAFQYNIIAVEDNTDGHFEVRTITIYTGATREVTLNAALTFTPVNGDVVHIIEGAYFLGTSGWW